MSAATEIPATRIETADRLSGLRAGSEPSPSVRAGSERFLASRAGSERFGASSRFASRLLPPVRRVSIGTSPLSLGGRPVVIARPSA